MKSRLLKSLIIIFLFILFIFITAKSYASSVFNELSQNIFRLHILANSDSEEDQILKLKVRDNVIKYIREISQNYNNKDDIIKITQNHSKEIKEIALSTIKENGYDYNVSIEFGNFYFPTKYYGNISLPSGSYDALRIKIGKAEGQNWWCSLFPPLCFTDVSSGVIDEKTNKNLKNNLNNEEYEIMTSQNTSIKFKFKIIELLNK